MYWIQSISTGELYRLPWSKQGYTHQVRNTLCAPDGNLTEIPYDRSAENLLPRDLYALKNLFHGMQPLLPLLST